MNLYEANKSLHFSCADGSQHFRRWKSPSRVPGLGRSAGGGLRRGSRGSRGPAQVTRGPAQLCGQRVAPGPALPQDHRDWLAPCQNQHEAGVGRMALGTMTAVASLPLGLRPARPQSGPAPLAGRPTFSPSGGGWTQRSASDKYLPIIKSQWQPNRTMCHPTADGSAA